MIIYDKYLVHIILKCWQQIDEGRAELPLTADKQDTFPIGLVLETGTTHQIIIGNIEVLFYLISRARKNLRLQISLDFGSADRFL